MFHTGTELSEPIVSAKLLNRMSWIGLCSCYKKMGCKYEVQLELSYIDLLGSKQEYSGPFLSRDGII